MADKYLAIRVYDGIVGAIDATEEFDSVAAVVAFFKERYTWGYEAYYLPEKIAVACKVPCHNGWEYDPETMTAQLPALHLLSRQAQVGSFRDRKIAAAAVTIGERTLPAPRGANGFAAFARHSNAMLNDIANAPKHHRFTHRGADGTVHTINSPAEARGLVQATDYLLLQHDHAGDLLKQEVDALHAAYHASEKTKADEQPIRDFDMDARYAHHLAAGVPESEDLLAFRNSAIEELELAQQAKIAELRGIMSPAGFVAPPPSAIIGAIAQVSEAYLAGRAAINAAADHTAARAARDAALLVIAAVELPPAIPGGE